MLINIKPNLAKEFDDLHVVRAWSEYVVCLACVRVRVKRRWLVSE